MAIDSDPVLSNSEKAQKKQNLYLAYNLNSLGPTVSPLSNSFFTNDTMESVVGKYFELKYLFVKLNISDRWLKVKVAHLFRVCGQVEIPCW